HMCGQCRNAAVKSTGNVRESVEKLISENEERYGNEIRTKYGDTIVDKTRSKLKGLTEEQYKNGERLRLEFEKTLKAAFDTQNPAGELAQKACELHREWLSIYYPDYNREYHKCLGEMYVNDERFRANYDKLAAGCTEFLRDAINIYCK
ncbi:MAG TPA: TipAS antibiotic-recognition domain-containing protein, partial [Atribacterota bacterium]|nr:TipAS antibiotic-recognition domain-containing protein [Atribacterota bacterium]